MSLNHVKSKRSLVSITPDIVFMRKEVKRLQSFIENQEDRYVIGQRLCLLEAGTMIKRFITSQKVSIGDIDYEKNLKLVDVNGAKEATVSLVYESDKTSLRREEEIKDSRAVYYVRPKEGAPPYVQSISQRNPWILEKIPVRMSDSVALLVKRNVSASERDRVRQQNDKDLSKVKSELRGLNIPVENNEDVKVMLDVGFQVLRYEFGYGEKQQSHWRPALKNLFSEIDKIGKKLSIFMINGDENIFDIDLDSVYSFNSLDKNNRFENAVGSSLGLK